ncbi:UNVERIFIED_CONTAM: hypothetical protein FKN15_068537 [Acipenser sinensis]
MVLSNRCKAALFVRFFLGSYLRFLGILKIPLTVPTAFDMPFIYAVFKKFLKKRQLENIDKDLFLKPKKCFDFVQGREDTCPVRGSLGDPGKAWRSAAHPVLMNPHKDLAWQVVHEILPVRAVMYDRGMGKSPRCPFQGCGAEETSRHLLWECEAARRLWKKATPLLAVLMEEIPVGEQLVRYGPKKKQKGSWQLWCAVNCFKEALYRARNLLVLSKELSCRETYEMGLRAVQDYVSRDVNRRCREEPEKVWQLKRWPGGAGVSARLECLGLLRQDEDVI